MCVTFIISSRTPFYQIIKYRDTRAYMLDPCIQEFYKRLDFTKYCFVREKFLFFHFLQCGNYNLGLTNSLKTFHDFRKVHCKLFFTKLFSSEVKIHAFPHCGAVNVQLARSKISGFFVKSIRIMYFFIIVR